VHERERGVDDDEGREKRATTDLSQMINVIMSVCNDDEDYGGL
jgi:hypothetical protein